MAAPMRDAPPDRPKAAAARSDNFEYDDNEWDIGIGDLIIDLDADIEKNREVGMASASGGGPVSGASAASGPKSGASVASGASTASADHSATLDKGLKMKIKRTKPAGKASEAKHEIVKPHELNGEPPPSSPSPAPSPSPSRRPSAAHRRRPDTNGAPSPSPSQPDASPPPPLKRAKTEPDPEPPNGPPSSVDACVGTSVGTVTEPDCLGPCEPGTSVTLEGIVWHETEGGVLVVNVTWRGKTYVGTLLDCTRHDWAPPRFCDSPAEELDARTPKGRGKRGRAPAPGDLSDFTETRSSVHSKLRNGGAKGRRGGSGAPAGPGRETQSPPPPRPESVASPTGAPAARRKARASEDDSPASRRRPPASPPSSPALLECPEPNCSKKYKHVNGLKYHRSHAHGALDDDESKDVASLSENDESNADAPSPKSPDAAARDVDTTKRDDRDAAARGSRPSTPQGARPLTPAAPVPAPPAAPPSPVEADASPAKPGVLRFGPRDGSPPPAFADATVPAPTPTRAADPGPRRPSQAPTAGTPPPSLPAPVPSRPPAGVHPRPPTEPAPLPNSGQQTRPRGPPPSPQGSQFKVKPTASLMPSEDARSHDGVRRPKGAASPGGSPSPADGSPFGSERTGREDVQSPAYSDISDDNVPAAEPENDKGRGPTDRKREGNPPLPHSVPPGYGMYQFYGQSPYLVPAVQAQSVAEQIKIKDEPDRTPDGKGVPDRDAKRDGIPDGVPPQKLVAQHYYPYGYVGPGYAYNVDPGFGPVSVVPEDKLKDPQDRDVNKESPGPVDHKPPQGPPPGLSAVANKLKQCDGLKDGKHSNENHQILKESIEMKSQMNPYLFQRQHIQQREEEMRRYYMPFEQSRRKESLPVNAEGGVRPQQIQQSPTSNKSLGGSGNSTKPPSKEGKSEEGTKPSGKEDAKPVKQEGQKPTMETTGPPPPPTSQYYLHPSYMQPPHYGGLPFDPVYRGLNPMLVPGHYGPGPYLHPGAMPRYHAPEDLSRPPPPAKTLDLLQHHPQYYSSHKIHELQERALKSPTPKAPGPVGSPGGGPPVNSSPAGPLATPPAGKSGSSSSAPADPANGKDSRSPPPQRHVHTHHHTHVGLGYPLYPAPYGAAVLASQRAAAVTVVNSFPPK